MSASENTPDRWDAAEAAGSSRGNSRPAGADSPAERPATAVPEMFGRYRILQTLGQGAMGAVFLAEDTQLARRVALKIPKFSEHSSRNLLERFYREARAAATLRHAHICPVYDVGEIGGTHYLTMAFIEGKSLADVLKKGKPLTERQAAGVVRKLALGLAEAHAHGVVHRDLKPANIMIDRKGEPVVTDFGLARQLAHSDESRITQTGAILGTPAYMSPEQVEADPEKIGPASDVYALGVILYELLTGQLPFQGPVTSVLAQIVSKVPAAPATLREGLDPALEAICLRMMARQTSERYGSMDEVVTALGGWLRGGAASREKPPASAGDTAAQQSAVATRAVEHPSEGDALASLLLAESEAASPMPLLRRGSFSPAGSGESPPPRPWWLLPAGAAAAAVVVLLGAVFLLKTPTGTVRIELSDPDSQVEVAVDGGAVSITGLEEPLQLKVGEHELVVAGPRFRTVTRSFTVRKGDNPVLHVQLEPLAPRGTTAAVSGAAPVEKQGVVQPTKVIIGGNNSASGTAAAGTASSRADEWTRLFNGRDLSGWRTHASQPGRWRVENGNLIGSGTETSHLYTDREDFRDFHLRVEARINDGGNSGVYLRAPFGPIRPEQKPVWPGGYEAQINSTHWNTDRTGSLRAGAEHAPVAVVADAPVPPGEWFRLDLIAHGNRLIVRVNDQITADYVEDSRRWTSGTIALQAFGLDQRLNKETVAEFRKIDIQEFPAEPAAAGDDFASLFNGTDLSGWTPVASAGGWSVRDGVLTAAPGDGWLATDRDYADFELELEYRLQPGANSGVILRGPLTGAASGAGMLEAQIIDDGAQQFRNSTKKQRTGAVWNLFPASPAADAPPNVWNRMSIRAAGQNIEVSVNGRRVAMGDLSAVPPQELKTDMQRASGRIGLLRRAAGIEFRNIRLREIRAGPSQDTSSSATRLFGGDDLEGWSHLSEYWAVRQGMLVGLSVGKKLAQNTYVCSPRPYADFELEFQVRLKEGRGNSGVQVRSQLVDRQQQIVAGPQVDIGGQVWGALYGEKTVGMMQDASPEARAAVRPAEFNDFFIRCQGSRVLIRVNGVVSVDREFPGLPAEGLIAWQLHSGAAMEVEFRNIQIRELSADSVLSGRSTGVSKATGPPSDAVHFQEHTYKFFPERLSWREARQRCEALGGSLAVVDSDAENAFIAGLSKAGLPRLTDRDAVWLGATDEDREGDWTWVDGSKLTFSAWAIKQPNNKQNLEHYLLLLLLTKGKWADQPNESLEHDACYVCEWDSAAVDHSQAAGSTPPRIDIQDDPAWPRNQWIKLKVPDVTKFNWLIKPTVKNGVIEFRSDAGGFGFPSAPMSRNLAIRARVKPLERGGNVGLSLRDGPDGGRYAFYNPSDGRVGFADLGQSVKIKPIQDFFEFEVTAVDERLSIKVNGEKVLETKDTRSSWGWPGLNAWKCRARFTDLEIKLLDELSADEQRILALGAASGERRGGATILQHQLSDWPKSSTDFARFQDPILEVGLGSETPGWGWGAAGVEIDNVRRIRFALDRAGFFKKLGDDAPDCGFKIDYHTPAGYTKRVALSLWNQTPKKYVPIPRWGQGKLPDQVETIGWRRAYDLDLSRWAPPDWDGRVWFNVMTQNTGAGTRLQAHLLELEARN